VKPSPLWTNIVVPQRPFERLALAKYDDDLGTYLTRSLTDGLRVVTFHACTRRNADSDADGRAVTFWSGSILASAPRCLHLRIWIDGASTPRRARIPIGRRC
jgi:hypothetical protein